MRRLFAVGLSLALLSCARQTAAPPPPPLTDYTAAQREIWSQLPSSATYGVAAGRFGHVLERVRALRAVVSAGPLTRKKIDAFMARAQAKLGFDPLDAAAWGAHGISVDAPVGMFGEPAGGGVAILVAVDDVAKASAVLEPLLNKRCHAHGRWLVCGDDIAPPASPAESRWAELASDPMVRSELLLAAKIPAMPDAASFGGGFFVDPQSVVAGLDLGEERLALTVRYHNSHSGSLKPYVTRDPGGKSLLGAAHGAIGFARLNFSPSALWALAQRSASSDTIDKASNAMLAATGIDLKADLVYNLTGEVFGGLWQPTGLMSTLLIGTRDDARTADMARRLDSILAGVVASFDGRDGVKTSRAVEKSHGRQVYVYKADITSLMKSSQLRGMPAQLELHLAAAPGALLLAFDRGNREAALEALGGSAHDFLDGLDPEVRSRVSTDAFISGWGHGHDFSAWYKLPTSKQVLQLYSRYDADLPGVMTEMASLMELIYDHTTSLTVHDQDITLNWTMRLL